MRKILLIEDNEIIRENVAELLELSNYQIFSAENGKTGVQIALREIPDLIICDIMMPLLDGYGILHMLQKNDSTKNIPFIFLTAKTENTDIRKGMELGADDYITKPFNETDLLNAIESRLKRVDQLKEEFLNVPKLPNKAGRGVEMLKKMISNHIINKYKKKQIIFSEGNRASHLYYVLKGKVKTYKTNSYGKELVLDLYTEGDFLGYIALLENSNQKETAEALEETELVVINKEEFEQLITHNYDVSRKFIQMLAKNVTEKEEHLLGLAYNSLRKKVAEALLKIYRKYNNSKSEKFSIDISRDNLAAIAGTATESLVRTLTDFKSEKLIDIEDSIITILNENKLQKLLN